MALLLYTQASSQMLKSLDQSTRDANRPLCRLCEIFLSFRETVPALILTCPPHGQAGSP